MNNSTMALYCVFLLVSGGDLLIAKTTKTDLGELTRIAELDYVEYKQERDKLINSRTELLDLDKAVEKGWQEGLLALIINARISGKDWFEGWDNQRLRRNRAGGIMWYPYFDDAVLRSPTREKMYWYYRCFLTERLWKFKEIDNKTFRKDSHGNQSRGGWSKFILDHYTNWCGSGGRTPKPYSLWQKIARESSNKRLLVIAYNNLTSDNSLTSRDLIKAKLKANANKDIKAAIMYGLLEQRPDYATEILTETYSFWKNDMRSDNKNVAYLGFRALIKQPSSKTSLSLLRKVILDPHESVESRTAAMLALPVSRKSYDPNDISCLESLLSSNAPVVVRKQAVSTISSAPKEVFNSILSKVMEKEKEPSVLYDCIQKVGLPENHSEITNRMQQLINSKDKSDEEKEEARKVIWYINRNLEEKKNKKSQAN